MRIAILLLISVQFLAAETFTVIHKKTGWPNGKGSVEITDEGIRFEAKKEKRSRQWGWLDIQYFDRISETEFDILTYQDQRKYLGRDRSFRFLITEGALSDQLFEMISAKLERPVTDRVVRQASQVIYEVPVKHQHGFGGCEGVLQFTKDAIYYVTEHTKDAREWQLARDVNSVWSADKYRLEIHTYDNNRREFSRSRVYKFDLKEPLNATLYRDLKLRMYSLETAHLPYTSESGPASE
jgi:hypothetical protein